MPEAKYSASLRFHRADSKGAGERAENYFNSASIGLESLSASAAATDDSLPWVQALEAVKERCATFFGVEGPGRVTLFHNTTAGVQRVLSRLQHIVSGEPLTLLTTDLEYPGIIAALDENWQGRVVIAEVAQLIWDGRSEMVEPTLRKILQLCQPDVIYVSHVARVTGFELDAIKFIGFAKQINPRLIVILDGAQAAGNIRIRPEVVNGADFYVASGHKWLGGRTTLGIVVSSPEWRLSDPSQSYSRRFGSAGTGIAEALRSLLRALEEFVPPTGGNVQDRQQRVANHNRRLAGRFERKLMKVAPYLKPVISPPTNGIVTIPDVPERVSEGLEQEHFRVSVPKWEPWRNEEGGSAPGTGTRFLVGVAATDEVVIHRIRLQDKAVGPPFPPAGALRLCFHLHHEDADVDRLVAAVDRLAKVK